MTESILRHSGKKTGLYTSVLPTSATIVPPSHPLILLTFHVTLSGLADYRRPSHFAVESRCLHHTKCRSPHLIETRERIRINGEPISRDMFARYFWTCWCVCRPPF